MPYGFPTGAEFKNEIIDQARAVFECDEYDDFAMVAAQTIFDPSGGLDSSREFHLPVHHRDFFQTLHHDRHSPTIDVFLRDHDQFSEIGRFYAALTLLRRTYTPREYPRGLQLSSSILKSDPQHHETDWYAGLITALRNGCDTAQELETKNNLTIVTFNYDQSLEIYLENFLAKTPRHGGAIPENVVDIIHLYGRLPQLELKEQSLGPKTLLRLAYEHHEDLRIIGERTTDRQATLAQQAISTSRNVIFIGFGFDPTNLGILGLPKAFGNSSIRVHTWNGDPYSNRRVKDIISSWRDSGAAGPATYIPAEIENICFETEIADEVRAGLLGTV